MLSNCKRFPNIRVSGGDDGDVNVFFLLKSSPMESRG